MWGRATPATGSGRPGSGRDADCGPPTRGPARSAIRRWMCAPGRSRAGGLMMPDLMRRPQMRQEAACGGFGCCSGTEPDAGMSPPRARRQGQSAPRWHRHRRLARPASARDPAAPADDGGLCPLGLPDGGGRQGTDRAVPEPDHRRLHQRDIVRVLRTRRGFPGVVWPLPRRRGSPFRPRAHRTVPGQRRSTSHSGPTVSSGLGRRSRPWRRLGHWEPVAAEAGSAPTGADGIPTPGPGDAAGAAARMTFASVVSAASRRCRPSCLPGPPHPPEFAHARAHSTAISSPPPRTCRSDQVVTPAPRC